ncbi:MAG TPA: hypothetical protein VKF37_16250 [Chloroflexota bacterium]|nr:hypothetical protein [Chloroflexota bacterium]
MAHTGVHSEGLVIDEITEDEWNALPHARGHRGSAARTVVRAVSARPVYIYGLTEPGEPWNVRYVGKAQQKRGESHAQAIERRLRAHIRDVRTHVGAGYRKINWLRHVLDQGPTPGFTLLDAGDAQTWADLEKWHITAHRAAGFDLVNETDGGDGLAGYIYTLEQRLAMSRSRTGKKKAPAHAAKLVAGLRPTILARASATHCKYGHALTPDNLARRGDGRRRCKTCTADRRREYTQRKNARNGKITLPPPQLRTHCPEGHEYTPENTYIGSKGERSCRLCQQQASRRSYEKRIGKSVDGPILPRPELRTQCPRGHEYTPENTYINPRTGGRSCKECRREKNRQQYRKKKTEH